MKDRNWNESHDWKWQWIVAGIFVLCITIWNKAEANISNYNFPPKDNITMDVEMANGVSGTYTCPSARHCYIKSLQYEARGAEQYCVSLVMKRNGKVIWWRKYQ